MEISEMIEHPIFSLRAIYIRNSNILMSEHFDPLLPGQSMRGQFRISEGTTKIETVQELHGKQEIYHSCAFTTKYDFQYIGALPATSMDQKDISDDTVLASISAEITAHYSLPKNTIPNDSVLSEWKKNTVAAHCWPYWREYCQNTMARMSLPVMIMPMLATPKQSVVLKKKKMKQVDTPLQEKKPPLVANRTKNARKNKNTIDILE